MTTHVSVLLAETMRLLAPRPDETALDATFGGGGVSAALYEAIGPGGRLVCSDADPAAVERARAWAADKPGVLAVHARFSELGALLDARLGSGEVLDVLTADFGLSSIQLDDPARGFAIRGAGPLDMRLDTSQGATLVDWVAGHTEDELAHAIRVYGDEPRGARIARAVRGPILDGTVADTAALAALIRPLVRTPERRIDPATRVMQALRIAVNDELGEIAALLALLPRLRPGGRAAFVSFHSGEARLVKHALRALAPREHVNKFDPGPPAAWRLLTRHAVEPGEDEIRRNPRARSAQLRAVERTPDSLPS